MDQPTERFDGELLCARVIRHTVRQSNAHNYSVRQSNSMQMDCSISSALAKLAMLCELLLCRPLAHPYVDSTFLCLTILSLFSWFRYVTPDTTVLTNYFISDLGLSFIPSWHFCIGRADCEVSPIILPWIVHLAHSNNHFLFHLDISAS